MKKLVLVVLYILVAGSVSAAGVESMVLEAEPLVEQTNLSGDQESMLVQIILILATLFILLWVIHLSDRFFQLLKHQAIRIAPKSYVLEFMAHYSLAAALWGTPAFSNWVESIVRAILKSGFQSAKSLADSIRPVAVFIEW